MLTEGNHEKTQSVWSTPGFELGTIRIRGQCDEFRPALCSVNSKTLSQTALHSRREVEQEPPSSTAATMLL